MTTSTAAGRAGSCALGRSREVSEVVPTAVLLASEDGSSSVGQTLGPGGGDVVL